MKPVKAITVLIAILTVLSLISGPAETYLFTLDGPNPFPLKLFSPSG
jgi:hypothetical protein